MRASDRTFPCRLPQRSRVFHSPRGSESGLGHLAPRRSIGSADYRREPGIGLSSLHGFAVGENLSFVAQHPGFDQLGMSYSSLLASPHPLIDPLPQIGWIPHTAPQEDVRDLPRRLHAPQLSLADLERLGGLAGGQEQLVSSIIRIHDLPPCDPHGDGSLLQPHPSRTRPADG